jgi:hypothetical protein
MEADPPINPPAYTALRVFGWVVLALMVLTVLYAGWLALTNWDAIVRY